MQVASPAGTYGWRPIIIIATLFFTIGFVTWLNGPLITFVEVAFHLDDVSAFLVPACFYLSYLLFPIPAMAIARRTGLRGGLILALIVMAVGTALFGECVNARWYPGSLAGLSVLGAGLSLLQITINPYISLLGPADRAAQRIAIMGVANKFAGILAPLVFGALVMRDVGGIADRVRAASDEATRQQILTQFSHTVHGPYLAMAVLVLLAAVWVWRADLPEITMAQPKAHAHHGKENHGWSALVFGVIAMFLYVGVEVMAGDVIGIYARDAGVPLGISASLTAATLLAMMLGYGLGMILVPRIFTPRAYLGVCCGAALILCGLSWLAAGYISVACVALLGFANAMILPILFPLVLQMMGARGEQATSLLVMAFCGGAVLPQFFVHLVPYLGTQRAFVTIMVPAYLVIAAYAWVTVRRSVPSIAAEVAVS